MCIRAAARRQAAGLELDEAGGVDQLRVLERVLRGQPLDDLGRGLEVLARHQVRVGVVVDDGRVLVRPGDGVDDELAVAALGEEAEPEPEPGRLDEHLGAAVEHQRVVAGDRAVLAQGVGDVGVDVVLGGAGDVARGCLLPGDRAPREQRAAVVELARPFAGGVEHADAKREHVARMLRARVREERCDVDLGVPEVVSLVAVAGHTLGRDAVATDAGGRLQQLEEVEPDGALERAGTFDVDVRLVPEVGGGAALVALDRVVAGVRRSVKRAPDVTALPVVRDELRQRERLAGSEVGGEDHVAGGRDGGVRLDLVPHSDGEFQAALAGPEGAPAERDEIERAASPRIVGLSLRHVRDQLRGESDRYVIERDDLVAEREQVPVGQRSQATGADAHAFVAQLARDHRAAHVQRARGAVERLAVDEQADDGAVGRVDRGLPGPRHAVGVLGIDDRPRLVEAVEDHTAVADAEVAVSDGEDRCVAGRSGRALDDAPIVDVKGVGRHAASVPGAAASGSSGHHPDPRPLGARSKHPGTPAAAHPRPLAPPTISRAKGTPRYRVRPEEPRLHHISRTDHASTDP